ncbi:polysaccharide pyruvyl transferase family protein [Pseudonocardia sp. WMMC193]|uniref:polysaccharide pyruvyl transferase family protein n=1 Tax=Pseudonocardia sp. WMMC193 TaxID=2911965 RepID=UPI001F2ED098|nr:polysaccharide pyruvyl transferase family protein [Pseudonocardia sp. WMMC193]MCF7553844.1 polysaccharide pyruvyl transferase family protein [Pseudonocardia sp. WMMC193]
MTDGPTPRVLVLWADGHSTNLGVQVLAEGTAELVRRVAPGAEIVHQNYGSRIPELPIGSVRSLMRERVTGKRGMQAWLGGFDLVIDTRAGDSFADIYGLRRLLVMSLVGEFAAQAGTAVVLGPQTIGPFRSSRAKVLARRSLRRAALTVARDSASETYAVRLGVPATLRSSDVVFALPVPTVERRHDVLLNVSGLLWRENPHVDHRRYRRVLADLVRGLDDAGRRVSLLAHVIDSPDPDNDVPAVREFASTTARDAEIVVPGDLAAARAAVASAAVVVASRMHASLNALSVGTPAVSLAYSRKFRPLFADLGWDATVDLRDETDPVPGVLRLLGDPGLADRVPEVLDRARASLGPVEAALGKLL